MKENNIIFDSTYANVITFIKGKNKEVLTDLCLYIGSSYLEEKPNKIQQNFINEFFGKTEWRKYIKDCKEPQSYFRFVPKFDLPLIRGILMFELIKLIKKSKKEVSKKEKELTNEKEELKRKLKLAIDYSHDESGVFWKDDGWSNVSQVLEEANLITLK